MNVYLYLLAESIGERTLTALKDSVLGMVVVFAALIILWGTAELLHVCVSAGTRKKAARQSGPDADRSGAAPDTPSVPENENPAGDDAAVVAAITAAIALMTGEPAGSFKVVSFRRAEPHTGWNRG